MAKKLTRQDYLKGFRVIFSYISKHQRESYWLGFFSVLAAIINVFTPYASGKLLDAIIYHRPVLWIFVAWFTLVLSLQLLNQFKFYIGQSLGRTICSEYVIDGLSRLLRLPLYNHKQQKMSVVASTVTNSGNEIDGISVILITDLVPNFLAVIFALIISFTINGKLALVLLIGTIVYTIFVFSTVRHSTSLQRQSRDAWRDSYRAANDAIDNIGAVKQMTSEDYQHRKNNINYHGKALTKSTELFAYILKTGSSQKMIMVLTQGLVFGLSIILINQNQITVGDLLIFNGYAAMLFGPFMTLAMYWKNMQNGLITIEQSEDVLKIKPENYHPENAVILDKIDGAIKFNKVYYAYEKGKEVLRDISFEVKPGEVVALVGKSGEGKSTLIDLISGYHFAKKGQVLIDGHNVKNLDLTFLRSQIAVVPQEVVLFNDTIETNVKYGTFGASRKQVEKAADQAHALEFIEKFPKKWKQVVGERGVKLSVGQKQRVAIARAILRNPKILILDEPTSALDAESEHFITKSLEELMRGRTTFIIAHRLSTVRQADKIIVIENGQVAEIGKHDELITKEDSPYRRLYELQVGLHE